MVLSGEPAESALRFGALTATNASFNYGRVIRPFDLTGDKQIIGVILALEQAQDPDN